MNLDVGILILNPSFRIHIRHYYTKEHNMYEKYEFI